MIARFTYFPFFCCLFPGSFLPAELAVFPATWKGLIPLPLCVFLLAFANLIRRFLGPCSILNVPYILVGTGKDRGPVWNELPVGSNCEG